MKMYWTETVSLLLLMSLVSSGAQSLKNPPSSAEGGGLRVPWHDAVCCESPGAHTAEEKPPQHNASHGPRPLLFTQCHFRSEHHSSGDVCVDVMCDVREDWTSLNCELNFNQSELSRTPTSIRLHPVRSGTEEIISADPVICEGNSSLKCSLVLDAVSADVMVTVTVDNVTASPVHLKLPAKPVKLVAPVNVSHHQTIDADLVLTWEPPAREWAQLRYEVRYSEETQPEWTVLQTFGDPRMVLDLEVNVNYTIQIRCSNIEEPSVWSDWSQPHHIHLDTVTYVPEIVIARPGEAITVYCVFNDRNLNASSALWTLNYQFPLPSAQYHAVNHRVSQITVVPSENHMYELLQCTQDDVISYSQIFVKGAAIDISCQTNGDINVMECSWKNDNWTDYRFKSRWADVLCEKMEQREREGEELGSPGPECLNQRSCTLHPLRMTCYRLWLEMDSRLGPVSSKPVYVTPRDYVKPHTASDVVAQTHSSGLLSVSWKPHYLLLDLVQCQFRYYATSTVGQPVWRVQPPVVAHRGEVPIPNMCVSYAVQVRCQLTHGSGYWSDWSQTVYSAPLNSRAPEHGPDFWRVFSDDVNGNQTTVTLLFKHLQTSGSSYCVDGLIIRHQGLNSLTTEERTGLKSSHSFEWNQEVQTVTVETYNSLGRSADNFHITLSRQIKRRAVRSLHVLLVNNSCVTVSWSVEESSSVPQSLVLQWTHSHPDAYKTTTTWKRLRYTDPPVHIRGDFSGSEEFDFSLYPVFADGEGHPAHAKAVRRDPGAFMLLMIISFLSIVLLVTLALSQNQMKKIVWKDVPNPNKCSWAKGVDFRKVDHIDSLLRAPDALAAWPHPLPAETFCTVVIVDKIDPPDLVQTPLDPPDTSNNLHFEPQDVNVILQDNERRLTEDVMDNLDILNPEMITSEMMETSKDNSGQPSVNYATVLPSNPKLQHFPDDSSCSSCDKGNFSANNSDISDSSHGALWELESCRASDSDRDKRDSGSYNSLEELSETSDQEGETKQEKDLYYLTLKGEDSGEEEEEEESDIELLKSIILNEENCPGTLLDEDLNEKTELLSGGFSPLYLPQFRTVQRNHKL